ncbi:helix-turn-helix domain-containing protein [Anaerocolumna xylanovorans]|uniref:AraC-type DNA-binding protein n=1 Tax=Anaerocolumna xylanovorans DSM 12503 TaxID=1121345 RepID=A0A1M7Y4N6_9FIRM|nr:AraC family transcriptional regulator [Anaerocolumna xylanovorans]SHO47097.1 AraC-type DNA-binding protein [Anaerocolumna xylanovorans DSM 12503]
MNKDKLIRSFTDGCLGVDDFFIISVLPYTKVYDNRTKPGACGLVIPIKGKARFTLCGEGYELEPGVILHAGPSMELDKKVLGEDIWEFALLHYYVRGPKEVQDYLEKLHGKLYFSPASYNDLLTLVKQLHHVRRSPGPLNELRSKALLYSIIEQMLSHGMDKKKNTDEDTILSMVEYIDSHYDRNPTVMELSELAGMDIKRFSYLFGKIMGECPKKYITMVKINRAKELLIHDTISVTEISTLVGIEDALYFSRLFKKYTNMAPSVFRERFGKNPW